MLINLRNALMAGKRLPYDNEVEYLESTGTQWIDTGYAFQDDFSWEIMFNGLGYSETLFGGRTAAVRTSLLYQRDQSVGAETTIPIAGYNGSATPFVLPDLKSGTHTVKAAFAANKGSVWVDGVAQYTNQSFNGTYISGVTHAIFADNLGNGDVREFANSKVYALKMWQNGVLVRDLIPVRKGTVGYLYDRVSGKLFGNAGTGDFVLGPDVVPATWVDGEYWNRTGVATALSGASRCDNFIPVQPSSSVTFYLGARPGGTTLYMVQYNANKERVNSTHNSNGAARTVTIPANCYYIRVSAETATKNEAYVHDNTNDSNLLRNGIVVVG